MHRIDTSTAQVDKFGAGKNGFSGGNPQTGELPTALDELFFDSVQEEICAVIEGAGNTLNKGQRNQLITALKKLFLQPGNNLSDISNVATALANLGGAPLASPTFTGTPKAPTAAVGTNTTQIATTAFAQALIASITTALVPAGTPMPWPLSTPPSGWLSCNGSTFNTTSNPQLAIAYPSGILPDLRGEFIRGYDGARGVDPSRSLLSAQGDAMRNFTGTLTIREAVSGTTGVTMTPASSGALSAASLSSAIVYIPVSATGSTSYKADVVTLDPSTVVPTAAENRPRNIAFNYIVRAA